MIIMSAFERMLDSGLMDELRDCFSLPDLGRLMCCSKGLRRSVRQDRQWGLGVDELQRGNMFNHCAWCQEDFFNCPYNTDNHLVKGEACGDPRCTTTWLNCDPCDRFRLLLAFHQQCVANLMNHVNLEDSSTNLLQLSVEDVLKDCDPQRRRAMFALAAQHPPARHNLLCDLVGLILAEMDLAARSGPLWFADIFAGGWEDPGAGGSSFDEAFDELFFADADEVRPTMASDVHIDWLLGGAMCTQWDMQLFGPNLLRRIDILAVAREKLEQLKDLHPPPDCPELDWASASYGSDVSNDSSEI